MLLRSMTKHVKDQNWFAVGLDFFIVVFGILITFQVTNWNEARSFRAQEAVIIAGIIVDLRADKQQLSIGIGMANRSVQAINYALHGADRQLAGNNEFWFLNRGKTDGLYNVPEWQNFGEDAPDHLWSMAVVRYYPVQGSTAFDTLMANGNLGLLQDSSLVARLQSYRRLWQDIVSSQDLAYRPFRDQAIFVGQKFGLSPFVEMPEKDFIALIRDNPELEGAFRTLAEYTVLHRNQLSKTQKQTRALLAYLGEPIQ